MLTSAELNKFREDGSITKWLADFNKMFVDFGTIKDPLQPEQYFDSKLFLSA